MKIQTLNYSPTLFITAEKKIEGKILDYFEKKFRNYFFAKLNSLHCKRPRF